ncbi:MAG: S8 family serine peptidase [Steroidobacteraceae bacterium]
MHRLAKLACTLAITTVGIVGASAQVGVPGLPQLPLPPLPQLPAVTDPVTGTLRTTQSTARAELRKSRVRELLRTERATVESDAQGHPILRRQIGVLSPTPEALARARTDGFTLLSADALDALGMTLVVLQAPEGMSTRRALKRLRELDPEGSYDFNHLYLDSGAEVVPVEPPAPVVPQPMRPVSPSTTRIGLIDSGVDGAHPAFAGATIVRFGCEGAEIPAMHGTAVASLLVGEAGGFHGVAPAAALHAADVFCGHGGGSISLLAVALDWMARERVAVVNISLVGAKSVLLTALVRAMGERGHLLVAAVGNDGPSAPPLFPAAYPEVIGVTGVDAKERVLPEACRGEQVDFAARGADLVAAQVGGGFGEVRGTSFATPIVAGLLAASLVEPDKTRAAAAMAALEAKARDLGREGVDTTYGKGLVGGPD